MPHVSLKLGKGGKGLQPCDEQGQYTNVAVPVFGNDVFTFEDFIDAVLDHEGALGDYRNASQETKDKVDAGLAVEWNALVSDAVEEQNRANSPYRKFYETDEELEAALPELLGPTFARKLLEVCGGNAFSENINPSNGDAWHKVSSLGAAMQQLRYPQVKNNPITEEEYEDLAKRGVRLESFVGSQTDSWQVQESDIKVLNGAVKDAIANGTPIMVWRGIGGVSDYAKRAEIVRGMVDDDDDTVKTLLGSGSYGSVEYTTLWNRYADENYSYDGLLMHGIFLGDSTTKVLVLESSDWMAKQEQFNQLYAPLEKKKPEILDGLRRAGFTSTEVAQIDGFLTRANFNIGFLAMLRGYDVVFAEGHQIDVLNAGLLHISEEYEDK